VVIDKENETKSQLMARDGRYLNCQTELQMNEDLGKVNILGEMVPSLENIGHIILLAALDAGGVYGHIMT